MKKQLLEIFVCAVLGAGILFFFIITLMMFSGGGPTCGF